MSYADDYDSWQLEQAAEARRSREEWEREQADSDGQVDR